MGFNEILFRFFPLAIDILCLKPLILNHQSHRLPFVYNKKLTGDPFSLTQLFAITAILAMKDLRFKLLN